MDRAGIGRRLTCRFGRCEQMTDWREPVCHFSSGGTMPTDARPADIRSAIAESMTSAKSELAELVRFRSVHDPRQFPVEECVGAAQWVQRAFVDAGIPDVQLIETNDG